MAHIRNKLKSLTEIQFFSWMLENEFKAVKLRVILLCTDT